METLCEIDPELTIPPYEDQNNRNTPVDQTLLLSPEKLTARCGDAWQVWAARLLADRPWLGEELDGILKHIDRRSRIVRPLPLIVYRNAYILQRALDCVKGSDKFRLRALAQGRPGQKYVAARNELAAVLQDRHVEDFLAFARDYYGEVRSAQAGLWHDAPDGVLERSDIHPKLKRNVLDLLVGDVFGLDQKFGARFQDRLWQKPAWRRMTVCYLCQRISETIRQYGRDFHSLYKQVQSQSIKEAIDVDDLEELTSVTAYVQRVICCFAENFQLDEAVIARVSNPYSLSQLYNLIEQERHGYTKQTVAAHLENAWRLKSESKSGKYGQCFCLPFDNLGPVDGVLRRTLDRQAFEIAKILASQMRNRIRDDGAEIDLGVIVEKNQFYFSASFSNLRKNSAAQKKFQAKGAGDFRQWIGKVDRIRSASQGICPYTGKPLNELGEIDHIIPQAFTVGKLGTVFNSEANLIYASSPGNKMKGK
ncbi:MAG: hypothetical protein HUK26_09360, partial [Duodenibacillus sp.]|nr:hypothetical protein [Duodenibacillus sp.]